MLKKIALFTFVLGLLFVLEGCMFKTKIADSPAIITSIAPLRYFITQITGEDKEVISLIPSGANPETYELTPDKFIQLDQARLYLSLGVLPFEKTTLKKATETIPHLKIVNVGSTTTFLQNDCGEIDLHLWTSPKEARVIVLNIYQALCNTFPENKKVYASNLKKFLQRIDKLDASIHSRLSKLKQRTFAIYHPALGYFARDYGLIQLSVEHNGSTPGAGQFLNLITRCKENKVKIVFIQKEFPKSYAYPLANAIGAKVVTINPLAYDWEKELNNLTNALLNE